MDVLRRLATGQVYQRIAADLGISASTVRTHLHNLYRKLDAADRAQAVLIGVDRGWLEVPGRPAQ
jgi:DNA-binding NarL/FixJ family response regulator